MTRYIEEKCKECPAEPHYVCGHVKSETTPLGWKEAAIAWEVCASIHRTYAKGKDALYTTRQADYLKHAEDARAMYDKMLTNTTPANSAAPADKEGK